MNDAFRRDDCAELNRKQGKRKGRKGRKGR